MFTPYRITFVLARRPYRIGLLFTHKNGAFGTISVTERNCSAPAWYPDVSLARAKEGVPCGLSPVARLYLAKNEAPEEEAGSAPISKVDSHISD